MIYDIHIFACTNERKNSEVKSCGEAHGMLLIEAIKQEFAKQKIQGRIRVQRSGCLGICVFGPTIAIYPSGHFYVNVQQNDIPELVESHFIKKEPLERLLLKKHPKEM